MAVHAGKSSLKLKNLKSKPKPQGSKVALTSSSKEKPVVPIEEIRRQGLMLAWQGIGEATRARAVIPAALTRARAAVPAARPARAPAAVKPSAKRVVVSR